MRSITDHSRARLAACGLLAPTFAAFALTGCGAGGHKPAAAAGGGQQPGSGATATAPRSSAGRAHEHASTPRGTSSGSRSAAAGSAGKRSSGSRSAVKSAKAASPGVAAGRGSSTAAGSRSSVAPASTMPRIAAGAVLKTIAGTGNAPLGPLSEKSATVLQWSTAGASIEIFTSHGFRLVSSQNPTGRVRLTAGQYPGLRIATKGSWKIELRAQA